jgi:hypothetical protein
MLAPSAAKTAPATPETAGTAETAGPAESGTTEAGTTEAAEKSTTRHPCHSFPHWTIKFLDTTDSGNVNEIDGCLR